ncbi:MAG: hypothetical protein M3M98_05755 [Nitrospirota bacterium]|nr:hypothetical protein [Nitrospirota bacterium]
MRIPSSRRSWPLVFAALSLLGANGCPVQAGCGVSGGMPGTQQGFGAQSWTCQASVQLAKGATISSPGPVKKELLAKKESTVIQVAGLRNELSQSEERAFGFGGKGSGGTTDGTKHTDDLSRKITQLLDATERLDQMVKALEALTPPAGTFALDDGTWAVNGDRVTFHAQSPYIPSKNVTIPYVIRSEQGEVLETGFLPIESIRAEPRP